MLIPKLDPTISLVLYNKNILNYLKYILYRIDNLKTIFVKYRLQNIIYNKNNKNKIYFNIFKLYILTHYVAFIRLFNNA